MWRRLLSTVSTRLCKIEKKFVFSQKKNEKDFLFLRKTGGEDPLPDIYIKEQQRNKSYRKIYNHKDREQNKVQRKNEKKFVQAAFTRAACR